MKIKIIYPDTAKHGSGRRRLLKILKWPFLAAAVICPTVNICIGGKAWSIIALAGIAMIWSLVFAPDLVEYNRLSQSVKSIFYACIMLILIDVFLVSGWAVFVVPLVCLGGLVLSATLFFTDFKKQKQNMLPMMLLDIAAIISAIVGFFLWEDAESWPYIAMGGLGLALLVSCIVALGKDFKYELCKRFHIK